MAFIFHEKKYPGDADFVTSRVNIDSEPRFISFVDFKYQRQTSKSKKNV